VGAESFPIDYAPRSLAVDLHAPRIAVGTKAGTVHVATWAASAQEPLKHGWSLRAFRPAPNFLPAVRGIAFLDTGSLVAGWGPGNFRVFDLGSSAADPRDISPQASGPLSDTSRWMRRFKAVIPLPAKPGGSPPGDVFRPVALGLSTGPHLHLLSYKSSTDQYDLNTHTAETLLVGWDARWGQVVDAVRGQSFLAGREDMVEILWLLGSTGMVVRCDVRDDGRVAVGHGFHLEVDDRHSRFAGLDACAKGLIVRASHRVTFLRFRQGCSGVEIDGAQPSWIVVPDIRTCVAFYPGFGRRREVDEPIEQDNPIWAVASTSRDELVWSSWHDGDLQRPAMLPQRFPGVGGAARHVRCSGAGAPGTFLVFATKDHEILVIPALDCYKGDKEIERLAQIEPTIPIGSFWDWQRRLKTGFLELQDAGRSAELVPTDALGEDNLRALVHQLFTAWECWRTSDRLGVQEHAEEARRLVVSTLLRFLQRAQAFGPDMVRELATTAFEIIARRPGRYDGTGDVAWEEFGLLAGFLRKWIMRGSTYSVNTLGLEQLCAWNEACGRNLDAAVYLIRLLEHRVDCQWESKTSDTTARWPIWDVVCAPPSPGAGNEDRAAAETPFILSSLTDGSLRATAGTGRALRWQLGPAASERMKAAGLIASADGSSLSHADASAFEQKHRHGPYARSLFVCRESSPVGRSIYLVVFGLRGWRSTERGDDESRKPSLLALRVRPRSVHSNEEGAPDEVVGLEILDIECRVTPDEIYAFCEMGVANGRRRILAGTSGVWGKEVVPFVEFEINEWETGRASLGLSEPTANTKLIDKGHRSLLLNRDHQLPGTDYNPCWAIVAAPTSVRQVIFAGFQGGGIKRYERLESGGWQEGFADSGDPAGIKLSAAVWSLRVVADTYLAYGTGDGTIGLIELSELEKRERRYPSCHVIHAREEGPVCGLTDFDDNGDRVLMALTEKGVVTLFSLEQRSPAKPRSAADAGIPGRDVRLRGYRLDQFPLGITARALAMANFGSRTAGDTAASARVPSFVVGSMDGSLHAYRLLYPSHSGRRHAAADRVETLLTGELKPSAPPRDAIETTTPSLVACVGAEHGAAWLRTFDLGDPSLTKAALWWELRPTKLPADQYWHDPEEGQLNLACLKKLTDEVYRWRPFSKEPVKMLWELASRSAHGIGKQLVPYFRGKELDERGEKLLNLYQEFHVAIDDLCNRWIGFEQAGEAQVLADSFETSFDGLAVLVLAVPGGGSRLHELRIFLLRSVIQRRLSHSDPKVPFEVLRVINDALVTVLECRRHGSPDWTLCMRDVQSDLAPSIDGKEGPGFYDLMILIGDLGERMAERINPGEPLYTELARFFALSVLLLPDSSLIVAQVLSESRLTEHGIELAASVVDQFRYLEADPEALSVKLFKAYFAQRSDFTLHRDDLAREADRELSGSRYLVAVAEAMPSGKTQMYTSNDFLLELKAMLLASSALAWLRSDGESDRLVKEFIDPYRKLVYFHHSQEYLRKLDKVREKIRPMIAGKESDRSTSDQGWRIRPAIQLCDEELREIKDADIFQPQRNHYTELLLQWRAQLVERAETAMNVLQTLDHYNRHVHRSSADALMTGVLDLVMQAVPISFDEQLNALSGVTAQWREVIAGPTRQLIRKRLEADRRLRDLFDRADRIVDATHLGGSLLTLALSSLVSTDVPLVESTITLDELFEQIRAAGLERGLTAQVTMMGAAWHASRPRAEFHVRGTRAVWDVIAREAAANVAKHDKGNVLHVDVGEDDGGRFVRIAGRNPFFETLSKTKQISIREKHDGAARAAALRELVDSLGQPGTRLGEGAPGAGMGISLIMKVAGLCHIVMSCRLRSLEDARLADLEKMPMCLEFVW
jgi:hypothetical protein